MNMTEPTTCKTCEWWDNKDVGYTPFIGYCKCLKSTKQGSITCEADTCDQYKSNDKQKELELE